MATDATPDGTTASVAGSTAEDRSPARPGDRDATARAWPLPVVTDVSALLGGVAWGLIVGLDVLGPVREILALALLVVVPLGLGIADTPRRDGTRTRLYRAAALIQPVAVVPVVVSLALPTGALAALLGVPWLLVTALVAAFGCWRFLQRGPWPLCESTIDAGLVYAFVGGGALVLDRAGVSLVFDPMLVALTAVHFHYAGFALALFAGLAGRVVAGSRSPSVEESAHESSDEEPLERVRAVTTGIVAVGPAVIATGITAAALSLPFAGVVEFVSVGFFTTAVTLFSATVAVGAVPDLSSWTQRILVGAALVAVTASMGFAVLYGLARWTGGTYAGIHAAAFGRMVRYHGQLNALGFALLGLVGWRLAAPGSTARDPGVPFSRLAAGRRVGRDFLSREGYAADADASGMMASVEDYAWNGFDAAGVDDAVAQFYERSEAYRLTVRPDWNDRIVRLVPAYRAVARRVGQLSLPLGTASPAPLRGEVVGVDGPDDEAGTRAWIRSNARATDGADRMTYVATYGRHVVDDVPFLRVTFPLPGANLTGLLRVENHGPAGEGIRLSSNATGGNADDAGLYLVVRGFGIRLPLDETLTVMPVEGDADAVTAVHEVGFLGRRVVSLYYDVAPADEHSG